MSGFAPQGGKFAAQVSEEARARTPARFPARQVGSIRPARPQKKPTTGRPGIGSHFWSFNFTNSLICGIVSSCGGAPPAAAAIASGSLKSALAAAAILAHSANMAKSPRVTFKPQRVAEGEWQIQAACPGVETKLVTGFKSKAEIDEWLAGDGKIKWLRSQGYAK
jgi:hypothetical protein